MTRGLVFLASAVVAASLGVRAQSISGEPPNSPQHVVTITGCLNSSATGALTISDDHGTTYTLSGNTDIVRSHNGEEMEISGVEQASEGASSNTLNTPHIQVVRAKIMADHCSNRKSQADHDADGSAVASVEDAVNTGQLPQTSTILPLLGLIGLGSLVAGFFARH